MKLFNNGTFFRNTGLSFQLSSNLFTRFLSYFIMQKRRNVTMAQWMKATDYHLMNTGVTFESASKDLKDLFDRCEYYCKKNLAVFTDKKILREGSDYDGVWLETQPMGGEMYAKRDMEAALNNQLIFMENQRKSGRLPGMIKYQEPFLLQVSYDWLQGFCFPVPAFKMYFLIDRDPNYLALLYECLKSYDEYLWKYRDSDNDGCLETWCTWDTGEDNSMRFTKYGVPDGGFGGEDAPFGIGKLPFASMDLMSYSCQCREVLGSISDHLQNGEGDYWRKQAAKVREKLHDYLWIEEKHACYDKDCDHQIMPVLIHNNLRCMYYGSFSQEMADSFIRHHLLNPDEFWTYVPLPSIAVNDPCFTNINFNNWGGQPQGLTYQRAIQALEQYGHVAEIRLLGKKWLNLLMKTGRLVQQYDPFDGTPCVTRSEGLAPEGAETERYKDVTTLGPDGYGPTILAALEYYSLLCGVNIAYEQVRWSCVSDFPEFAYCQTMYGHDYRLTGNGKQMTAFIDGQELFVCTCGVQITTDLNGRLLSIDGIESEPVAFTLKHHDTCYHSEISPNEAFSFCDQELSPLRKTAFDYPYQKERS